MRTMPVFPAISVIPRQFAGHPHYPTQGASYVFPSESRCSAGSPGAEGTLQSVEVRGVAGGTGRGAVAGGGVTRSIFWNMEPLSNINVLMTAGYQKSDSTLATRSAVLLASQCAVA